MNKAQDAVTSAKDLLASGDFEGAANRAYYAMFHAARAALLSVGESALGRHGRIIGRFGLLFVRSNRIPPHLGRAINEAQVLRTESDYGPGRPEADVVRSTVRSAEEFVLAVRAILPQD